MHTSPHTHTCAHTHTHTHTQHCMHAHTWTHTQTHAHIYTKHISPCTTAHLDLQWSVYILPPEWRLVCVCQKYPDTGCLPWAGTLCQCCAGFQNEDWPDPGCIRMMSRLHFSFCFVSSCFTPKLNHSIWTNVLSNIFNCQIFSIPHFLASFSKNLHNKALNFAPPPSSLHLHTPYLQLMICTYNKYNTIKWTSTKAQSNHCYKIKVTYVLGGFKFI